MKILIRGALIIGLLVAFPDAVQRAEAQRPMPKMPGCNAMDLRDANLAVEDTANGIRLTITTEGDVSQLRQRLQNMAEKHTLSKEGMMHGRMIPFTASYDEVPNGARLNLTPKDPAQLEQFRVQVRQHVERMKKGGCPMMQGMQKMMEMMETMEAKPETPPEEYGHDSHHP